jgi:hypothetical protein
MQDGYDHSYFFISTFIEDHLRFHRAISRWMPATAADDAQLCNSTSE